MGGFHIELVLFSALGKYVEESGGPPVLQEPDVIRKFSLKSFIMGKAYNRCKRIHQLFAAVLEILHMQAFLSRKEEECYEQVLCNDIENIRNGDDYTPSKDVQDMTDDYKEYLEETKTGEYGKTAQFWIGYTEWMHLYHEYIRSIRIGDFDLYIYCLPKFSSLFFALNYQNFARWLVRYHDNLLKLSETHPEVYQDFQEGFFATKRTQKDFSALAIELTLEQTINTDAASQKNRYNFFN